MPNHYEPSHQDLHCFPKIENVLVYRLKEFQFAKIYDCVQQRRQLGISSYKHVHVVCTEFRNISG